MNNPARITLSRAAFLHNIQAINSVTGHQSLAIVIKSNAYGHGIDQIASMAEGVQSISYICTAGISEAIPLRKNGITKPILVLSYLDGDLKEAIKLGIHLGVSTLEEAQALSVAAQSVGSQAYIHVKIDTGMGRKGILPEEAVSSIRIMTQLPNIVVHGIFTHLSDTGHEDHSYSYKQLAVFDDVLDDLEAVGISIPCTHAQSSSSLDMIPKRNYSFIRAGASIYGVWKHAEQRKRIQNRHPSFDLIPVLEWRVPIIQIKRVPVGSYIGYSRTFITDRPTVVALASVGYADGYTRALSNKGVALLHGHLVPVIGIVSMNITAFDITNVPEVQEGDELILLGDYQGIRAHEVAQAAHRIPNEIITGLNPLLSRTVVPSHKTLHTHSSLPLEKTLST